MNKQHACYDNRTEVLTDIGWKHFKNVLHTDKICTMNPDSLAVEYQVPIKIINTPYNGEMYNFKTKTIDLCVTPNHRMVVKRGKTDKITIKTSEIVCKSDAIPKMTYGFNGEDVNNFVLRKYTDGKDKNNTVFGDKWCEKVIDMDAWLKFMGMWLSEGFCSGNNGNYITSLCQAECSEFTTKIDGVFEKLPFVYNRYVEKKDNQKDTVVWTIHNKQLYNYLSKWSGAENKSIGREYMSLSKRQLSILEKNLMLGDGHVKYGKYQYMSVSKQLIDDMQELWAKLGYTSSKYIHHDAIRGAKVCYKASRFNTKYSYLSGCSISKSMYYGDVGSVAVPNGIVLVRRGHVCSWSGSSATHT